MKSAAQSVDLVGVVEALYRLDLSREEWLETTLGVVRPLLDRHGLGITGNFYECADPCSYAAGRAVVRDVPVAVAVEYLSYVAHPEPSYIADSVLSRSLYFCCRIARGREVQPGFDRLRCHGVADKLTLNAVEPDGSGCCFGAFQADRSPLTRRARVALTRIAGHFRAAHRLRRRFARGDVAVRGAAAVMTADGRVHHAVGVAATNHGLRQDLQRAVRARDTARTLRGRQDSLKAIRDWSHLVGGRWTLLDHVEQDGRHFVLAVESEPDDRLALLSPREREIAQRLVRGQTAKVIAYEIALAPVTVRVLIGRAMVKLGARSRAQMCAIASGLVAARSRGDMKVGSPSGRHSGS